MQWTDWATRLSPVCLTKVGISDCTVAERRAHCPRDSGLVSVPRLSSASHQHSMFLVTKEWNWCSSLLLEITAPFIQTLSEAGAGAGIHFTLVGWRGCLVALIDRSPESKPWQSVHTDSTLLCKDKPAFSMIPLPRSPSGHSASAKLTKHLDKDIRAPSIYLFGQTGL